MHKRPNVHDMHICSAQCAFLRLSSMHDMHVCSAQCAFLRLSSMHDMHICSAQCAPPTCTICIQTPSGRPHYTRPGGRPDSHYSWTNKDELSPRARQSRNDRGPPSGGPLPYTVGPGGPTVPRKARPAGGAPAGSSRPTFPRYFDSRNEQEDLERGLENQ